MEYQKIRNLLGNIPDDKMLIFITKKWIEVYAQSGGRYSTNKQIRFKRPMLRSDLCDYNDGYIVAKGAITVMTITNGVNSINNIKNRPLAFKNNAPFISCISKINGILIENAEDIDFVIPMYNLLEYIKNYSNTSGSLWNYYRDELTDETNNNNGLNKNVINSKSFKYKTGITGNTYNVGRTAEDYHVNKEGTKEIFVEC